jgi:hypothetical protein
MSEKTVPTLKFVLEDEKGAKWTSGVTWQEQKQLLRALEDRVHGIFEKLDEVCRAVFKVQEVLADSLTQKCAAEMLKYLSINKPAKSFKEWDLRKLFEGFGYGWEVPRFAFKELVKEGKIMRRGKSGWYRLHSEVES